MSPSPRDPRVSHPEFTPSERAPNLGVTRKIMGVPVSPKINEAAPPSTRSMIPGTNIPIPQEARVKVPISLGTLALVAYLGFWLANQRVIERELIMAEIQALKEATKENTKALEEARAQCRDESRSLSVIESRTAATQAEIVVIQSKLSK